MNQFSCGSIVLFLVPAFLISIGLLMIFKKDWMWTFTEHMIQDVNPQRTPAWERRMTINGVIVLLAGLYWLGLILNMLFD